MANDQFHIPGQSFERPLQEALQIADAVQYSPERMPGPYHHIKEIEERIHSYRRTALELEERREPGFIESAFGIKRQKVTLKDLIERESRIYGELFGPHDRLWLSHKGTAPHTVQNNLGDWFHVREIYDEKTGKKIGETTLHFETHPNHITKLYDGHQTAPMVSEVETLVKAIELGEERVREALYPLDQEIYDLVTEAESENIQVPDTVEEMFGKEIVARVLAEYRAKKGLKENPRDDFTLAA